jgi:hypothetical protein
MESAETARLLGAGSIINASLLMAVLWFLRRIILKTDKIDVIEVKVSTISHEVADLASVRERVAVLESVTGVRRGKPRP